MQWIHFQTKTAVLKITHCPLPHMTKFCKVLPSLFWRLVRHQEEHPACKNQVITIKTAVCCMFSVKFKFTHFKIKSICFVANVWFCDGYEGTSHQHVLQTFLLLCQWVWADWEERIGAFGKINALFLAQPLFHWITDIHCAYAPCLQKTWIQL